MLAMASHTCGSAAPRLYLSIFTKQPKTGTGFRSAIKQPPKKLELVSGQPDIPLLLVSCDGHVTDLNVICGLSPAPYQFRNQLQPASRSGLPANTVLHLVCVQLTLPLQPAKKPPYVEPRSEVPHSLEQALNWPTPPPGISRSN